MKRFIATRARCAWFRAMIVAGSAGFVVGVEEKSSEIQELLVPPAVLGAMREGDKIEVI